ncbi:branched-chain-amino-acid transaminase [Chlamydiota bacterium]
MLFYINGNYFTQENAKISVLDHGLLYGDGVFEGIRVYNSTIFKLQEHIDRLYESAKTIMLEIPLSKKELMTDLTEAVKKCGLSQAYIRLIITRGNGTLGLDPFKCSNPQVIFIIDKISLYPQEMYHTGLSLITVPTARNFNNALAPQIKSLNYLNNILAKIEAINAGVLEAIMLTSDGYCIECTGDNLFIIKKETLLTPPIYQGALAGVTRSVVFEIAKELSLESKEIPIVRHDLYNADECFLTGTAAEVIPVVKIDNRVVGEGKPGIITNKIRNRFKELTGSK